MHGTSRSTSRCRTFGVTTHSKLIRMSSIGIWVCHTSHEGKTPGVFYPDCVGQGSASELTSLRSPRDLNGYGYFHACLGWTGFGLRANIVEKYVLFSAVLHVAVALERNRAGLVVHLVVTLCCKFLGSCGYVREPWRLVVMNAG